MVVEGSGVAKTSLYRHFATKDDLVVAILERDDADYWGYWDQIAMRQKAKHKAELRRRLCVLTKRMGLRRFDVLADQLALLIDGAYVNGQLLGKRGPVNALLPAALALIAAAGKPGR